MRNIIQSINNVLENCGQNAVRKSNRITHVQCKLESIRTKTLLGFHTKCRFPLEI